MARVDQTRIAITFADGSLGVMSYVTREYFDDGTVRWERPATPEMVDAEIARTAFDALKVPVKGWRFMADTETLPDREYRDAWVDGAAGITHDMSRARALHLKRLRAERDDRLVKTDGLMFRANEQGQYDKDLMRKRQAWRDMPMTLAPALEAAKTVEELRAIQLPE